MFRVRDLKEGTVVYHHSDSDSTRDHVVFRISDGRHSVRHKFPINILPKDDSPPFLINNVAVEVQEGGAVRLEEFMLLASDLDSSDDYILYQIVSAPRAGHLVRRTSAHETGERGNVGVSNAGTLPPRRISQSKLTLIGQLIIS